MEERTQTVDEQLAFLRGFLFARGVRASVSATWSPPGMTVHLVPESEDQIEALGRAAADALVAVPRTWQLQVMPVGWTRGVR
jgi:hypothetical protein